MKSKIVANFFRLSQRERYIVIIGGVLALFLLFYTLVWSPLNHHLAFQREQVFQQRALLAWVNRMEGGLLNSRLENQIVRQQVNNVMVAVEHALAKQHLAIYLRSVKEPEAHQVELKLQEIPFDKFITWLQTLLRTYHLQVLHLQVSKTRQLGLVNVRLVLGSILPTVANCTTNFI